MSNGELSKDLENLQAEYRYKISQMSMKIRNNEYHYKTRNKMAEILAGYMASSDELEQLMDIRYEAKEKGWIRPSKYGEYKDRIMKFGL